MISRPPRPAGRCAPAIGAVHVAAWRSAYPGILPDDFLARLSVARQAAHYDAAIRAGAGVYVAAASGLDVPAGSGQRIVGFATVGPRAHARHRPRARSRRCTCSTTGASAGSAARLMQRAARRIWPAAGCRRAFLWVLRDNPSRWFYQRLGGKPRRRVETQVAGVTDAADRLCLGPDRAPARRLAGELTCKPGACRMQPCCAASRHDAELATDRVLILDFGSQVTQLIARRVRESGVYCEIWPFDADPARIRAFAPRAIILSGGPASVTETEQPARAADACSRPACRCSASATASRRCARSSAARSSMSDHQRVRPRLCRGDRATARCSTASGTTGAREQVWMSHGDRVDRACRRASAPSRSSEGAPFAAIADDARRYLRRAVPPRGRAHAARRAAAAQLHARASPGCRGDWTMAGFRERRDRAHPRAGRAGPGDLRPVRRRRFSSVAAVLIHEAIGDQLTCIFVDHGLLRQGEAEEVVRTFRDRFNIQPGAPRRVATCSSRALDGVTDPEAKRKTIGRRVHRGVRGGGGQDRRRRFPRPGHALSGRDRERQRRWRPERHDQVAPQCRRPARADAHEAGRAAARAVQGRGARARPRARRARARSSAATRSPAPAWRSASPARSRASSSTSCAGPTRSSSRRSARAGLYDAIWQAFAVLLPVRTVGVMGDGRTYDKACALRAVTSTDGMTAEVYPFDMAFLTRVAEPHRQRGARHQPRDLRHHQQAARDDRVGVTVRRAVAQFGGVFRTV